MTLSLFSKVTFKHVAIFRRRLLKALLVHLSLSLPLLPSRAREGRRDRIKGKGGGGAGACRFLEEGGRKRAMIHLPPP